METFQTIPQSTSISTSYRESGRINQSRLKEVFKGGLYYRDYAPNPTNWSDPVYGLGSLVDRMLEFHYGPSNDAMRAFDMFLIGELPILSDAVKSIADLHLEGIPLQDAINIIGWQPNWKMETRVEKIAKEIEAYVRMAVTAKIENKQLLPGSIQTEAVKLYLKLMEDTSLNEYTKPSERYSFLGKRELYFDHANFQCKAELDNIRIDHLLKEIQVIDYKTSKDVYDFENSFWNYRYDFQAAFYHNALEQSEDPEIVALLEDRYSISKEVFFVVIPKNECPCHVFKADVNVLKAGWEGHPRNRFKGVFQAFDMLDRYQATSRFDILPEQAVNNFVTITL